MSDDHVRVTSFEDLIVQVPPSIAATVARALNNGAESVLVTDDWIADETDLDAIDGEHRIFVGKRERATEMAWLFAVGQTSAWIPKSVSVLFSTVLETIEPPQRDLGDFARARGRPPEVRR